VVDTEPTQVSVNWKPDQILAVLDRCSEHFSFPMLDNGYVYPAATRLSLYRSAKDWAIVIEVFGFSPRSGIPDTQIYTFGSRLRRTKKAEDYVNQKAYEAYIENNPYNESTSVFPIDEGGWQSPENGELLTHGGHRVKVRDEFVQTPAPSEYAASGITLQDPPNVHVFEFCRLLAATKRSNVLATTDERRICVPHDVEQIMQLEEWFHPDVVNDALPSGNATFKALAEVLVSADTSKYRPPMQPNTHWKNWPEGGTL
jgi:hypothetical protein